MGDVTRRETYRRIWTRVKEVYDTGYVVSEAGLQAALYAELRTEFPKGPDRRRTDMGTGWKHFP